MKVIRCDINVGGEDLGFDIIQCKDCKFAYRGPDGKLGDPNDINCIYWELDGLEADDFCSRGEYGVYKWEMIWAKCGMSRTKVNKPELGEDLGEERLKEDKDI